MRMSISSVHAASFYKEVAKSHIVWSIKDASGFPAPKGTVGKRAMPFWSSESRALEIINNIPAYKGFAPVPIPWAEFASRWLPGLEKDKLLVGVNWSGERATGYDIEPRELKTNFEALQSGT